MNDRHYQTDYIKDSKSKYIHKKRKHMVRETDFDNERRYKIKLWTTFYRRNIHRFIETYLGIKLYPYQIVWIYLMSISDIFVAICGRATAKSFLVTLYAVCVAILYPNSKIIVGASSKAQAGILISEKLIELMSLSKNLEREIVSYTANQNIYRADFTNGSYIKIVAANEASRGNRATVLILDEFRIMKKEIVESVLAPFLVTRVTGYKTNLKYSDFTEEPKQIYISSAWYKTEWWYKYTTDTIKMMAEGKNAGFFATDMYVAIEHGIKTKNQIEIERKKTDQITFRMEYLNEVMGQSGKAYYKANMFRRGLKKAFYPVRKEEYHLKKNAYQIPKVDGEIRIVSVDIATRANQSNDNSIIICTRLLPSKKGYIRQPVYIESHHGKNSVLQAMRIKEVYYDFCEDESGIIVLDLGNAGISIFDELTNITQNEERGIEYPAFTVTDLPYVKDSLYGELVERTLKKTNAFPVIYPMQASAVSNSEMQVEFRSALQNKLFNFLITDIDAEDYLIRTNKEFLKIKYDLHMKPSFLAPYYQTNLLVGEAINLEMNIVSGNIKLTEPTGGRKDRFSSIMYMNSLASKFDKELLGENDESGDAEALFSSTFF